MGKYGLNNMGIVMGVIMGVIIMGVCYYGCCEDSGNNRVLGEVQSCPL